MESGIVDDPEQAPYGVRVTFQVKETGGAFEAETVGKSCFRLEDGTIATVRPPHGTVSDGFDVVLEAFESRGEAESFGRLLADALLWSSVPTRVYPVLEDGNFPVDIPEDSDLDRFDPDLPNEDHPHYSEGPVVVFDRRHENSDRVRLPKRAGLVSARAAFKGQVFWT